MAAVAHDMLKMVRRLGRSGDSRPIQWRPPTPLPPAQGTPWTMPWSSSPRRCGALLGSHEATFRQPVFQFLQRLCAKLRIFLIECIARQDLPKAPGSEPTEYHQSLHLSVHDGNGLYRLELAVRADTTLRQLDDFLRGMWLECCGHLSEFTILGIRYSNLAPHPDDPNAADIRADYWMEENEEHMDVAVAAVMPLDALVSYEYDYGRTTELFLENLGRHGDLVGLLRPRQPWHGNRIVVLARNEPDEECVACEGPARWRLLAPDYEAREPIPFCDECRPEAGRYQLVMNSPREGTNCYDNVMSWDGMPIGEPDF